MIVVKNRANKSTDVRIIMWNMPRKYSHVS